MSDNKGIIASSRKDMVMQITEAIYVIVRLKLPILNFNSSAKVG